MQRTLLWLFVPLLALACGCGRKANTPVLHVIAHAPSAATDDSKAPIRVSFDRPAVESKDVGRTLREIPLRISPQVPLRGHWLDRQTLLATPLTTWTKATRYEVEVSGALAERLSAGFKFSFEHDPLDVVGPTGINRRWVEPKPEFTLVFDQKVKAREVVEHCGLRTKQGGAVALVARDPQRVAVDIALSTAAKLERGQSYTLRCEKLPAATGNAGLSKPYETTLDVYPKLALENATPSDGARVTPDDLTLSLTFSTPIDRAELRKHVRLTPKHPALKREWLERSETVNELSASFEADTSYTLEIDGNLRDRFGQKLGKTHKLTFTTTDAAPSLSVKSGIYAIEADAAGYPVWSRNVESFSLECAQVPKASIVKVLTSQFGYDVWYDKDHPNLLDFKALGLTPKRRDIETGSKKNKWTKTPLAFGQHCGTGSSRGLYLAELRSPLVEARRKEHAGTYPYRVLGNVTNLGALLKLGPSSGLVWVASLSQATPIEGAAITLYDPSGRRVFTGSSDARGILMLPGSDKLLSRSKGQTPDADPYEEGSDRYREQRLIAVIEKDGDLAVVDGHWSDGISAWNFNLDVDRSGGETATRGFVETDRGIYRPGDQVHVKGLVRDVPLAGNPRVPSAKQIQVRVEDGHGAELYAKTLTLSEFGGFYFDLGLDPEARTGDYYIKAALGKQTFTQTFSVEEIRPVTFEITTRNLQENVRLGAASKLDMEARYLFGAPVTDAEVQYEVQRRRHWLHFPEYGSYSFEDWSEEEWTPWWEPETSSGFVSDGKGRTDDQGRFAFELKDEEKGLTAPQDYIVRASVRDAADQEVTKRIAITGHPSEFYLGVNVDSWVATAGTPFKVRVVALDHAGKPVRARAKLSLERVEVHCHTGEGPYGYWECDRKRHGVSARDLSIDVNAPLGQDIVAPEPGHHLLRVETKDARGNLVKSSASVWVIGPGTSYWASDDSHRIGLIPSKRSYAPGETALLVPETATDGATMLVTVERNGVLEARLERSAGTAAIQVALSETHAPNVFVSVALLRGRRGPKDADRPELKLGMANLPVSFGERALSVRITTEGSDFEPGQKVRGKVQVLGRDGAPVRAEVALSAADEGVLQVIDYRTPNPMASIYAAWGLGVETASSWTRVAKLHDVPEDVDEEEGADGSGNTASDRVRSRFVASAYWAPALVTDAHGEAAFEFEAPDNLTAFRLMAAAADLGSRFGSAEQRIRVRKDLLVAPIVPRFLMADDQIELGAVIHNYTNTASEVETTFDIAGVTPRKTSVRSKLAANAKAVVHVPVKVQSAEQVTYSVESAFVGSASRAAHDKVRLELPVQRAVVKDAETVFAGRGVKHEAVLAWQRGIDTNASALEIAVDRSGIADLGPSLKYLIQYPYGCLEQTMSGFVPLLKVRELGKSLKLKELSGDKLERYIELGVAKVIRHQHADGHFSLWPDSTPYPHLTVYALWGLNEARRSGVRVEKRALDLGLGALRSWVNGGERAFAPGDETGTLAMAAYVMAELGEPDPALNARLFAAKNALPIYGKAFLLRALRRAKAATADQELLLQEMVRAVRVKDGSASVDDPIAPESYYFSSASRSLAMVLSALLEADPSSALIAPLVQGLKQRRQGGRWASTQENVYGLLALSAYARAQATGKAKLKITLGDQTLSDSTLQGGAMALVRVPLANLTRGGVLSFEASEPVFYNAVLYKVRPEPAAAALDHGFGVRREYLGLDSGQPVTRVHVGDLVRVRLHLTSATGRRYVAITDPLPSGFESVNSRLATERDVSNESSGDADEGYGWLWDYRALRDERTDWFVDGLEAGSHVIEYITRATHVGTFTVPPARAEEMYQASVMGHSQSTVLTVLR